MHKTSQPLGFIGQGWIGKNFADNFEERGFSVVRFALEEPYLKNRKQLQSCRIVFIAVPTPTTPQGFNFEPVIDALKTVPAGATAVIKSTILPGTTAHLQALFPELYIMHSPEFLVERTVKHNVDNPDRNIIGLPVVSPEYLKRAKGILAILPKAPYEKIMPAIEAELVKYAGNTFLTVKLLYMNILYDVVEHHGVSWKTVSEALVQDPRIGNSHTEPVFEGGRGAGGHCFIKDMEAFRRHYNETAQDQQGSALLEALINYNIGLLRRSHKSLDLLSAIYGLEK